MTTDNGHDVDDSRVPQFACPHCGEDHAEQLSWLDDEQIYCQECGTIYDPEADTGTAT